MKYLCMERDLPGRISRTPLLERLYWFFFSAAWTTSYTHTLAKSLVMETSDHWPCVIEIKTFVPRGNVFRFENYWMLHDDFLPLVEGCWNRQSGLTNPTMRITAKFKALRSSLRSWQAHLPGLCSAIVNVKLVISFLELLEEWRDLSIEEWNFKKVLNG